MKKALPVGVEDFEDIMTSGYYYVDKTMFIKELLDYKGKINLFTRPRRFGKTLNLSMLLLQKGLPKKRLSEILCSYSACVYIRLRGGKRSS